VPKTLKHKKVTAGVTVTLDGQSVTHSFSTTVE